LILESRTDSIYQSCIFETRTQTVSPLKRGSPPKEGGGKKTEKKEGPVEAIHESPMCGYKKTNNKKPALRSFSKEGAGFLNGELINEQHP